MVEFIPAILVKTRSELLEKINLVKKHVSIIQLDIMDGKFVPNITIGLEELKDLPNGNYEFHWMVFEPEKWIKEIKGPHMHLVHIETVTNFNVIKKTVQKSGGHLGLALNPDTQIEKILPYIDQVEEILVMTVVPGFSGQKYIHQMETKIKDLRKQFPELIIEVDGGINPETAKRAYNSGANYIAAASAIFDGNRIKENLESLKGAINEKNHKYEKT